MSGEGDKDAPANDEPEVRARDEGEEEVRDDELGLDDVDVRNLLRRALDPPPQKRKPQRTLAAVQRQIRARSGGRFYADGWSTARGPRVGYLLTGAVVLLLIALVWLLLGPVGLP